MNSLSILVVSIIVGLVVGLAIKSFDKDETECKACAQRRMEQKTKNINIPNLFSPQNSDGLAEDDFD